MENFGILVATIMMGVTVFIVGKRVGSNTVAEEINQRAINYGLTKYDYEKDAHLFKDGVVCDAVCLRYIVDGTRPVTGGGK